MENDRILKALEGQKGVLDKMEVPREFEERLRQALEEKKPRRWPRYYTPSIRIAAAGAICLLLLAAAALFFRGGTFPDTLQTPASDPEDGLRLEEPVEQGEMTITPLKDHYFVKGTTGAYEEPTQMYRVVSPIFTVYPGILYRVQDVFSNPDGLLMAQISDGAQRGWIPYWYLTEESEGEITYAVSGEMIIAEDTLVYPHPQTGRFSAAGLSVEKGKVVHLIKEFEEWMCVDLITYDTPYSGPKWIRKEDLAAYDNEAAMEGTLRIGSELLDENGDVTGTYEEDMGVVRLGVSHNGMWSAYVAGGWSFYIRREDFIPNPFNYLRSAHPRWRAEVFQNAQRVEMHFEDNIIASIEGRQIEEFTKILSEMVMGPSLWASTEGDTPLPHASLVLFLPDKQVVLDMTRHFIMEHETRVDVWSENERYMLYQHPAISMYHGRYERILDLFGEGAKEFQQKVEGDLAWRGIIGTLSEEPYYFDYSFFETADALVSGRPGTILENGLQHPYPSIRWYSAYKLLDYLDHFGRSQAEDLLRAAAADSHAKVVEAAEFGLDIVTGRYTHPWMTKVPGKEESLFFMFHEAQFNDGRVRRVGINGVSLLSAHDGSIFSIHPSPEGAYAAVVYGGRTWGEVDFVRLSDGRKTSAGVWGYIVGHAEALGYKVGGNQRPDPFVNLLEWDKGNNRALLSYVFYDDDYEYQGGLAVYDFERGILSKIQPLDTPHDVLIEKPSDFSWD